MEIKRLNSSDFTIHQEISRLSKDKEISRDYSKKFLSNTNNILITAIVNETLAGFLTAYKLDRIDREQSMIFFYEIEVFEKFRRQGLGKALVEKLKNICKKEGCYKMYVLTNKSNIPAVKLYVSTGGVKTSEDDVLFDYRKFE